MRGDSGLSAADALRLAELNAVAQIERAENLSRLDEDEWLERWQEFRGEHSAFHAHLLRASPSESAA